MTAIARYFGDATQKLMTAHRNHYVPVWYQKGFVSANPTRLFYLDLHPETNPLSTDVPKSLYRSAPKQCFCSADLYTTMFFGTPNDEIERFLFGTVDNDGATAVRAVVSGEQRTIHDSFNNFFSFINAQKIRTPKGLDWIRANYGNIDQLNLMMEMQALRQMHCTMWLEAVREVVSAERSDIKFIVTDHPVTIYNVACAPDHGHCRYPNDPPIELIGSQTLFPLDANHCLILTNLEYAKSTHSIDPLRVRQHARHYGQTLARTDAWVRGRQLQREEVATINYVLKSRARRYIAAAQQEWLYPENIVPTDWTAAAQVLRPPENELWHFGGEIYIGHTDGSSSYQDAFGRTSPSPDYLLKTPPAQDPAPNEACPCASGKEFQACCQPLVHEDRMPWDRVSIRERNLLLIRAVENILGLNTGKSWEDVRRELLDKQVEDIHTAHASLWAEDTHIPDLLPRPDPRVLRAVYVGLIDPRTIVASVVGWLRYFDEIIVVHPFVNGRFVRPEYSPIDSPAQYKEQTIKNVLLLLTLAPFIHDGVVHLVPEPIEFNPAFRRSVWDLAKTKRPRVQLDRLDREFGRRLAEEDSRRWMARLPDDALLRNIRESSPDLNDKEVAEVMDEIRRLNAADPLALLQPLTPGKDNGQLMMMRGVNFDVAMFLAQLTGAVLYSDQRLTRDELAAARVQLTAKTPATDHAIALPVLLELDPVQLNADRLAPLSRACRVRLRALWSAALFPNDLASQTDIDQALQSVHQAAAAMVTALSKAQSTEPPRTPHSKVIEITAQLVVPRAGYGHVIVQRFLLTFGRRRYLSSVPIALFFGRAASHEAG